MNMVVTNAGKQALVNASQTGTASVTIEKIGVGTGKYTASAEQTGLVAEVKRMPIIEGGSAGDNSIHVSYSDVSSDAYSVTEVGLYLADGTLFSVYSQQSTILQKTETANATLIIDIAFTDIDVSSITFGDVTYSNAAATTANAGVVALATDEEVVSGYDTQKAITPAALLARTATESRTGLVELATTAETNAGTDTTRAVTPANMQAAITARIATAAETITGTSSEKLISPAGLAGRTATTARRGIVELATEAETITGTDADRAVTPAGVSAAISNKAPKPASDTVAGIVELASSDETISGTDDTKAVTPAGLEAKTATTSRSGIVELATTAEGKMGTDSSRAMTPSATQQAIAYFTGKRVQSEGGSNVSFYPSGQSDYFVARAGTAQIALARFTDDRNSPSLVFFKSRGTSVGTSKVVQINDIAGRIDFLVDNGNIDFTGQAVGARVAHIGAYVFENSTIPSGGTSNLGVRGALRFIVNSDSETMDSEGAGVEVLNNALRPLTDGVPSLGTVGRRWANIYATTSTISTSDANEKQDIEDIPEAVFKAWERVDFKQFMFRDAVAEKGEEARVHFGVIAQDVAAAFAAEGLDAHDYGIFCEDTDDEGNTVLGIRYAEALALECACQRRSTERILKRLEAIEGVK